MTSSVEEAWTSVDEVPSEAAMGSRRIAGRQQLDAQGTVCAIPSARTGRARTAALDAGVALIGPGSPGLGSQGPRHATAPNSSPAAKEPTSASPK